MAEVSEVRAALDRIERMPHGRERCREAEQAVALADAVADLSWQARARTQLAASYAFGDPGEHELALTAWQLQALDDSGDRLSPEQGQWMLRQLKWSLGRMLELPDIPLSTIRQAYDDAERRFREAGHGRHTMTLLRARLAMDVNSPDQADAAVDLWRTQRRDELSDCRACCARAEAEFLAAEGDVDRALRVLQGVTAGRIGCVDEPALSLSLSVDWLLRSGRVEEAVQAHVRSWQLGHHRPAQAAMAARTMLFLVRTGQPHRAWQLLRPRLSWVEEMRSPRRRMEFAATAATVLDAAGRAGGIDQEDWAGTWAAEHDRLRAVADSLAESFDARNGSTRVSTSLAELAAPDGLGSGGAGRPGTSRGRYARPLPATYPDAETDGEELELPDGLIAWRARVQAALDTFDEAYDRLIEAWHDTREDQPEPRTPAEFAAAAYLDRRVVPLPDEDTADPLREHQDAQSARRAWLERAQEEARCGDEPGLTARIGVELALHDMPEDREVWEASGEAAWAIPVGDPHRGPALAVLGDHPEPRTAALWLERSAEAFAAIGERAWQGHVLGRAAWQQLGFDLSAAENSSRVALSLLTAAGAPGRTLSLPRVVLGLALSAQGRPEEAVEPLRAAVREAHERGESALAPAALELCSALTYVGAWEELLAVARRTVSEVADLGPTYLAAARRYLGMALLESDRPHEAALVLEEALPVLRAESSPSLGAACWALAGALRRIDDLAGALDVYRLGAQAFGSGEHFVEAARCLESAGELTWQVRSARAAVPVFEEAAQSARRGNDPSIFLSARRSRAAALAQYDLQDGLAALSACEDEIQVFFKEPHAGGMSYDATLLSLSLLLQGGRLAADRGEWELSFSYVDRAESLAAEAGRAGICAEARSLRALALSRTGHADEAERLLRENLPVLADGMLSNARIDAARVLATLLNDTGRGDEGEKIWAQYGPHPV
ncbi:hypothetical protein SAMN05421595_2813 [Austwickia chelonae]|uniref:Uncharacterized protein n=1 Tax=Austwickia chelonae NBRC 105200 TaxID=1184607 RepID=K6W9P6_9MICO|nr:hypothetical protein [Austwickia chelonae]GAB78537.1 hypothetical protein AUCHE_10_00040 [Austwickia chelonae NBRC 105200]SEW40553.1 hypothetical protein SAMN05421595_2813 [Austwickia chelonae]